MAQPKEVVLRALELLCFIVALGFVIPPVLSDTNLQNYRTSAAMIIGGALFGFSLFLSWRRKGESLVSATIKLLSYLLIVYIAYQRAAIL